MASMRPVVPGVETGASGAGDCNVPPALDEFQAAALDSAEPVRVVIGAPGTGRTTVAAEAIARAAGSGIPLDQCVLIAPSRLRATALRELISARLRATSTQPVARSIQALAFGLLRQNAALAGQPAPRLLTGPEQDHILRELLAGHAEGDVPAPAWPSELDAALGTRGFRAELRDLLMRAIEWDVTSADLRALAQRNDQPAWAAAADVLDEYDAVTALSRPGAYDPSWILGAVCDQLESDPAALARAHAQIKFLVIDDAQELTQVGGRLVRLLAEGGARVMLIGDPDAATQGFRGAQPGLFLHLGSSLGAGAPFVLGRQHRLPKAIADVASRVTQRIGATGAATHRAPTASERPGRVDVALLRSVASESAHIAATLRRAHLLDGIPWEQMAVIVRGQSRAAALRRSLAGAGVPIASAATSVPLRDEPAVRPLLALFEIASSIAEGRDVQVDPALVIDLLASTLGAADAVQVRRIRRLLRQDELASGGSRSSDELMVDALLDPAGLEVLGPALAPLRRLARIVDAGLDILAREGADAEAVLWSMWAAAGVADDWRSAALAGGPAGARADRDLDAIVALFAAAADYTDRLPGALPSSFLEHIRGQEVAADRLVAAAPADHQVALVTAQGAVGRQWRFVVLAGVQEGVWPDLRLRGSLLGSERLVDLLAGRGDSLRASQAAVRADETRQFLLAITRASERLLVTAVRSEDEQPSPYLDLVDPLDTEAGADQLRDFTPVEAPMTLRGIVARLRREIVDLDAHPEAPQALAALAEAGVAGADPRSWWAFHDLTDSRPLRQQDALVEVSPSGIEGFTECGLRWLLTRSGGRGPAVGAASVGTLVHEIAAEFAGAAEEEMHEALDERWSRLGLGSGWLEERTRAQAHRMIELLATYVADAQAQGWQLLGVEVPFGVALGRARIAGSVDRLEGHPELGVRVIDLKTGSSAPTKEQLEHHPQLGAYQLAVVEGAFDSLARDAGAPPQSAGAALVQIGKAATSNVKVQPQAALGEDPWARDLLATTAQGMAAPEVLATVGPRCGHCEVRHACPLQANVGVK